ncbi:acetyl-CoA C-acyltransferase [Ureibacillus sp. FSL K6-8385]|uniref:Acetyl-CoA C-acyltransferase n=1 Tax=Ureibacillus terrenus TaxID=118246 RepID=A0A540V1M4_9BACL|nr:acetyl-CoA C-acyltransferase [Ureibacillus terrenus]MED3662018.1 acetyl-CoA C-acyltransferase [Ureibacillus terrenus]MED3764703.1 acetyl-CoA C-acyltransferase [Ureibacillus terrenus]TQE90645.1 acetyl-CoA C-acyltransferase [Ureibacillus terrenus]
MNEAVIVAAKRTPIAREKGALKHLEPHQLAAPLLSHLSAGIEQHIHDVILGNVVGPGGNIARLSALEAGLPFSVPGITLDRQCSAGLEAVRMACLLIRAGSGSCFIAGGVESASTSPFPKRARFSPDSIGDPDMGVAAEYVAEKFRITREMQDEYALLSWKRSREAFELGFHEEEILPIGDLEQDEVWRRKRNIEKIIKRAAPAFVKNGTVTAANSCGIHDGAGAVLVMEAHLAEKLGYQPVLRFVDSQVSGVHPFYPGVAPVPAIKALLERNGLTIGDLDLIEINEAFASKVVACARELSIPYVKLNVRGGALAIGHPYGASGAVLVTRLFYEVQRRPQARYVLAAIGSGGGVGVAVLFETV